MAVTEMNRVALRHAERQQKQHDTGAVVEQAFADDCPAQACRQAGAAQQALDDDSVGRGEDGAEHETPDQRHGGAEAQQRPHAVAENDRGQDHADGGEQQDDPAPPVQLADVDVKAAGEQQQRQRAVEKEMRQIGGAERAAKPPHHVQMQDMIAGDDQQRDRQRTEQHADCRRQPGPDVVDAAEQHRQRQHHGEKIDRPHWHVPHV